MLDNRIVGHLYYSTGQRRKKSMLMKEQTDAQKRNILMYQCVSPSFVQICAPCVTCQLKSCTIWR